MANHRALVFLDEILTECGIETSKDLLEIKPLLRGHLQLIDTVEAEAPIFPEQLEFMSSRGEYSTGATSHAYAILILEMVDYGQQQKRWNDLFKRLTKSDSWKNGR
jgi:hypothetical protein